MRFAFPYAVGPAQGYLWLSVEVRTSLCCVHVGGFTFPRPLTELLFIEDR